MNDVVGAVTVYATLPSPLAAPIDKVSNDCAQVGTVTVMMNDCVCDTELAPFLVTIEVKVTVKLPMSSIVGVVQETTLPETVRNVAAVLVDDIVTVSTRSEFEQKVAVMLIGVNVYELPEESITRLTSDGAGLEDVIVIASDD